MNKHENLPTVKAAQSVAVVSKQRDSLVVRGLVAFQESKKRELILNSQNERYRQARIVLNRFKEMRTGNLRNNHDYSWAFKMMKQLSDENFGKAYYPLCLLYREDPEHPDHNHAQHLDQLAFDWCFANQINQDVELWCDLGEMYLLKNGVEQNVEKAVYWFRKAAEQGDMRAQNNLGDFNLELDDIVGILPDDCVLELARYRLAAAQGVSAQNNLSSMFESLDDFESWDDVPGDSAEALKWYRLAAAQGYAPAQHSLGLMYKKGEGVGQDYAEAMKRYLLAAAQGDCLAQCNLGSMYRKGNGVEQDYAEAMKWYRLAAAQGHSFAQYCLRDMYKKGEGVGQDYA